MEIVGQLTRDCPFLVFEEISSMIYSKKVIEKVEAMLLNEDPERAKLARP